MRSILENANDSVLVTEGGPLDEPGPRIVYANAAFSRTTGYSHDEVVGKTPRILHGPGTDRARLDEIRAALASARSVRTELLNYRKDGTPFWVELDIVPVPGEGSGWPELWVSVQRETTERVRAEKEKLEAERRLRSVLARYGSDMITVLEPDGTPRYESPAVERALGYRHKEMTEGDVLRFVHPDDVEVLSRSVAESLSKPGESPPVEFRMKHADGSWRWFESVGKNLSHDPDVRGIVVVTREVTKRREAQEALKESEKLLRAVVSGASVVVFAADREGKITLSEGRALGSVGEEPGESVGRSIREMCADEPDILENVERALSGEEVAATVEVGGLAFETRYSPMRDEDGAVTGIVGVATDISERRRLERELEHRAFHDSLTGLPNRDLLADRLGHALGRTERRGSKVAVLFLDLDNFKYVNDSLGHDAGDELLVVAASRIRSVLRPEDTVSRLGGDEFVVLLEDVTGEEEAAEVAERVIRALKPPIPLGDEEVFVTASIGLALGTAGSGRTREALLGDADAAMYRAKEKGRNGYRVFHPEMRAAPARRLRLEGDLRRALERGELTLFYQPQALVETGEIVGAEALLRWMHPERGLVGPAEFIRLAEETGLIVPIGRWVLGEACRQAKAWQDERPAHPFRTMSVNLSARQFEDPALLEHVAEALGASGLVPSGLTLEITEGALMEDVPSTFAALQGLKDLGVGLAIDDFGTGYSSLSYLKRFPVDVVKVDRSIVSGVERDSGNEAIMAATIAMARAMDLSAVAEGVETAEEAAKLRAMGCAVGQGYYWWKPSPPEEAAKLLERSVRKPMG